MTLDIRRETCLSLAQCYYLLTLTFYIFLDMATTRLSSGVSSHNLAPKAQNFFAKGKEVKLPRTREQAFASQKRETIETSELVFAA